MGPVMMTPGMNPQMAPGMTPGMNPQMMGNLAFRPSNNTQLPQGILQPNPNVLDLGYNGPMNPNAPNMQMGVNPNMPPFANAPGPQTGTYGVDVNDIQDYSAKK